MSRIRPYLLVVIASALAGMIGAAFGTGTAQAVVATLVEIVNPASSPVPVQIIASPFSFFFGTGQPIGPGTSGTLNVTAITLTNPTTTIAEVNVQQAIVAGASCSSGFVSGGLLSFSVMVPANQTVHLTYPSPLVFSMLGGGGTSCIEAVLVSGSGIDFFVTGFVN